MAFLLDNGVIGSSDGGATWTTLNRVSFPWIIDFACGGATLVVGTEYHGIAYSTDGGVIWTPAAQQAADLVNGALVASRALLIAGTQSGAVFRSVDYGRTWTPAIRSPMGLEIIDLAAYGTSCCAVTRTGGPFLSRDGGLHWSAAPLPASGQSATAVTASDEAFFVGTTSTGVWRLDF